MYGGFLMARGLTDDMKTAINSDTIYPILLFEASFDEPVYLWSGIGQLTYLSKVYTGSGHLLEIDQISESTNIEADGVSFTLSGISSSILSLALYEEYAGKTALVKLALLQNNVIISSPLTLYRGYMDQMIISDSGTTCSIKMTTENRLLTLERPRISRYTDIEQQRRFAGDLGFQFVNSLQNKHIIWGQSS